MRVGIVSTTPLQPVWKGKDKYRVNKVKGVQAVCHVVVGPTPPQRLPAKKAIITITKRRMPEAKERRVRVRPSDRLAPPVSFLFPIHAICHICTGLILHEESIVLSLSCNVSIAAHLLILCTVTVYSHEEGHFRQRGCHRGG